MNNLRTVCRKGNCRKIYYLRPGCIWNEYFIGVQIGEDGMLFSEGLDRVKVNLAHLEEKKEFSLVTRHMIDIQTQI